MGTQIRKLTKQNVFLTIGKTTKHTTIVFLEEDYLEFLILTAKMWLNFLLYVMTVLPLVVLHLIAKLDWYCS